MLYRTREQGGTELEQGSKVSNVQKKFCFVFCLWGEKKNILTKERAKKKNKRKKQDWGNREREGGGRFWQVFSEMGLISSEGHNPVKK